MSERPTKKRARPAPPPASEAGAPASGPSPSALLAGLPGAFLAVDAAWRVSYVSPALAKLLGGAPEGDLREAGPALRWLKPHLRLEHAATEQPPVTFEHTPEEGGPPYEVQVRPLEGGLLIHLRERAGEQRLREELRGAQELLQGLLHGASDAIFTKDLKGRYQRINEAGARLLGREVEEILGQDDRALFPPEAARATIAHDKAVLKAGDTLTYEDVQQTPEGTRTWLSTKGVLRDTTGKVFGLFGIARDITERKRTEEELQRQAERLRLCMEAAHLVTWDADLRTQRLRWSDNLAEVTGVPVEGTEGAWADLLARVLPEDRPGVEGRVAEALQARDGLELEFRVEGPDGEVRWLRAKGRVHAQKRKPVTLMGVLTNVTAEKLAAEEARLHADFQEQLVGIVSHDIRSPLGAIINWSRLLASGSAGEDPQRTSRRITAAAVRIERLTRLLLDFTRARLGGGISIQPRKMDLHELFDKVAHEFRVAFPGRTVDCVREGDGRGLWDPDRLGQVLSNLVENALKYSPDDTSVRLSTRGDASHVVLEVHNEGKPIPPETLPHLFEPFRRGPQTTRTLKVSYGLGLYIVREIVLAHGGTIDVQSTPDEGTTLRVRLPRLPPGAHPGAPPAPASPL